MKRRQNEDCLSDLKLDRWLGAELTRSEEQTLEAHLASCGSCRQRRTELEEEQRRFTQTAPQLGAHQDPDVKAPAEALLPLRPSRQRAAWTAAAGALAAAAVSALLVTRTEPSLSPGADDPGIRTKGGIASLGWIVRRGTEVFAGQPDQHLLPGDALRFTVRAREPVYVAVLGLDAADHLSVYHPEGDRMSRVEAGQEQALPVAIELDATPGEERVYGIFCKAQTPLAELTAAIERSSEAPALPNGCVHERWSLKKDSP